MRARYPEWHGVAVNDGVKLHFEVHGNGFPTVLLLPTWSITHSRVWKMQVPFLARRYRVVTFDGRGNGLSDRPSGRDAYLPARFKADALAVMEATSTRTAITVALSAGAQWSLELLADSPERFDGAVFIGAALPLAPPPPERNVPPFLEVLEDQEGWAKFNSHYWLDHYEEFLRFFFEQCLSEPHSTKPIDDAVEWGLETTPETLIDTILPSLDPDRGSVLHPERARQLASQVQCPVLAVHGTDDRIRNYETSRELARLTNGTLLTMEAAGHLPHVRHPARVNLELESFIDTVHPARRPKRWRRSLVRKRRALFISSPIGLGHVQRDLAVVRELRSLVPDLEIHWWAQHPVTQVLENAGEYIHPAGLEMSSESRHWEEESRNHELHAFYAFRRMDEIFLANFMLFNDLVSQEHYDLWIGDESWEVDYYLHENPELKRAPYVFMTDVIGMLPVAPTTDARESILTTDYNAEMIEQRRRYPWIRDLSLYVGDFEDLPDASFGDGLPRIRDWAREWFEEVGYITPFDPASYRDKAATRRRLGYTTDSELIVCAVGGTAVGKPMLEKAIAAFGELRRQGSTARMVLVTGPRIDPDSLPDAPGLIKKPYVHDLFEHLACADAAVVQGGLSTTMELVAAGVPFVYFPLRNHWEQVHHVSTRLARYRAGIRLDYANTSVEQLALAMTEALQQRTDYLPLKPGAARKAALRITSLLGAPHARREHRFR